MTTAPLRSLDQRRAALAEANRRRSLRARRKAAWKSMQFDEAVADLMALLAEPPDWAGSWRIYDALLALPKMGKVKAGVTINRAGVSPVKTVAGATARQRTELERELMTRQRPYATALCQCGNRMGWGSRQCFTCRTGHMYPSRRS